MCISALWIPLDPDDRHFTLSSSQDVKLNCVTHTWGDYEIVLLIKLKIPEITRVNRKPAEKKSKRRETQKHVLFLVSMRPCVVLCNSECYVAITSLSSSVPAPAKDIEAVFHPNGETSQTLIYMMRPEPKHHPES